MAEFEIPRGTSLNHETAQALNNSMVKIDDTHVILSYSTNSTSVLKTFSIDSQGRVVTELNKLVHDGAGVAEDFGSLVKIDATHFALAYSGSASSGNIKTFSIDGSFIITQIDDLEHDTTLGTHNSLILLDPTHLVLAYRGADNDGFMKTFSFNGTTFGSITQLNSLEHDTVDSTDSSLVKIDDTHFMLAYSSTSEDGFLKTFSVDGSFVITQIASLEHDTVRGADSSLVLIDATHFMLAYMDNFVAPLIKTISIDGSYANITVLDTHVRTVVNGAYNSLVKIDDTHYILATTGPASDGFISTYSINGSFVITEIDNWEHDVTDGRYPSLVKLNDTHFIVAYARTAPGYLTTFTIEAVAAGAVDTGNAGMLIF